MQYINHKPNLSDTPPLTVMAGGAFAVLLLMLAMLWLTQKPQAALKPLAALVTRPADVAPVLEMEKVATPVYRYSVVAGGVHSVAQLAAAMARDPVVRAHYAGFNMATAHVVTLDKSRMVHVSYRIGDQIYWTRNKVRLAEGETLISDGEHLIRSRCGNLIADEPQGIMMMNDAATEELDAAFVTADGLVEQTPNGPLDVAAETVSMNNASARVSPQVQAATPYPAIMFNNPTDLRAPSIPLTTISFVPPTSSVPVGDPPVTVPPVLTPPVTTPPVTTPPVTPPPITSEPPPLPPPPITSEPPPLPPPPPITSEPPPSPPPPITSEPPPLPPPPIIPDPPREFPPPPTDTPPITEVPPEVPEPSSGVLFALALSVLLLLRRRTAASARR